MKFFSLAEKKTDEMLIIKLMVLFLFIFFIGVVSKKGFEALLGTVDKSESERLWIQYVIILIASVPRVIRSSYKRVFILTGIVSIATTFLLLGFLRMMQ